MSTKANEVTEVKFYDLNDVMRITGYKRGKSYRLMREINESQAAKGKLVIPGKVNALVFNGSF